MWPLVAMPGYRIQHLIQRLIGLGARTWPRLSQSESFPEVLSLTKSG